MKEGVTDISNELLDAILKSRYPNGYKEVILALIRLTYGTGQRERAVSVLRLARFLRQDKSNTAKRLRVLIRCKVVKETARPTCTEARQLKINTHFKEWKSIKN